jgi:hypothetical protein
MVTILSLVISDPLVRVAPYSIEFVDADGVAQACGINGLSFFKWRASSIAATRSIALKRPVTPAASTRAAAPIADRIAARERRLVAAEDRLGEFNHKAVTGNAANCGSSRHRPEIVALAATLIAQY